MANRIPLTRSPQAASRISAENPLIKRTGTIQRSKSDSMLIKRAGTIQRRKSDSEVTMANRIPPATSASNKSETARRSTQSRAGPPEHTAEHLKPITIPQARRARILMNLLKQYNIDRKERDDQVRNGTYDPISIQSKICVNHITTGVRLIRSLYREFVNASKRNNAEYNDRLLIKNITRFGNISNHDALYVTSSSSELRNEISSSDTEGSSTESEGSHAEQSPPTRCREYNMNPTEDMRNVHVQQNNALCVNQSSQNFERRSQSPTLSQIEMNVMSDRTHWHLLESLDELVQSFALATELFVPLSAPTINESCPRISDTDFDSDLETSPVMKLSETRRVNPVNQIQNTSTQSGNNDMRNNGPIARPEMPVPQAGPSRIRQKKSVSPILDTSSQNEGNDLSNNGLFQYRQRCGQQAGPSHNQDENPETKVDGPSSSSKNYQLASDPDMIPIGNGNARVPRRVLDNIDWKVHTTATRQLLLAIFPRSVLASHSLTGKQSPTFLKCPAKKMLDPKLVDDIVVTVSRNCEVPQNLVRSCIASKCNDVAKLYRHRQKPKRKRQRQKVNKPPSSSSDS